MNSFLRALLVAVAVVVPAVADAQVASTLQGVVTDPTGAVMAGARVEIQGATGTQAVTTDSLGAYRLAGLSPGTYTATVTSPGFQPNHLEPFDVPINRTTTLNVALTQASRVESVTVSAPVRGIDATTSSTATYISARQIDSLPLNGRNYLDLVLLTPGAINTTTRAELSDRDTRGALFGDRAGNTAFLIDGFDNSDDVRGGVFQAYTQDAIQEFQVIATGYKAEFGRGSAGIVNVITRSGSNQTVGSGSFFLRNDALDSSNVEGSPAPELARYDGSATIGGPVTRDRAWYFGSAERVHERRGAIFPSSIPSVLSTKEDFSINPVMNADRYFGKLSQSLPAGRDLRVEGSWTRLENLNQLASSAALPSASNNNDSKTGLAAVEYRAMSGTRLYETSVSYRDQRFDQNGDLASGFSQTVQFTDGGGTFDVGPRYGSRALLTQQYLTARTTASTFWRTHTAKAGLEYIHTSVDGENSAALVDLVLTSQANFARYGADSFQIPQGAGFATAADAVSRVRNHGASVFAQDDWRILPRLTLNLGTRFDYDSTFNDTNNIAARLGVAWAPDDRTAVRANWGTFYDRFRLGVAQGVPEFGGFNSKTIAEMDYPHLAADASLNRSRSLARLAAVTGDPYVLQTRFNIPRDAVVSKDTIQGLTGLTPDAFLAQLNAYLTSNGYAALDYSPYTGFLRQDLSVALQDSIRVQRPFETPYNNTFSTGIDRTIPGGVTVGSTYVHRAIRSILGVRLTNLSPQSRTQGFASTTDGGPLLRTYGPWYDGDYDALVFTADRPFNGRYSAQFSYTYARGDDNLLNPNLATGVGVQGAGSVPTDNLNIEADRGRSDLLVPHTFIGSGAVLLPRRISVSGVFRATSGGFFTASTPGGVDVDGDGISSSRTPGTVRNQFIGPSSVNVDVRLEKRFTMGRYTLSGLIECFNLFNAANPRVVENQILTTGPVPTFGETRIPLPGRETQLGIRLQF